MDRDALTQEAADGLTRALIGGTVYAFVDDKAVAQLEATLANMETLIGPEVFEPIMVKLASGGPIDLPDLYGMAQQASSQWTETPKKVLFLRVDFSDLVGIPIEDAALETLITTSSDQILAMSYGKAFIISTISPSLYRLPKTAANYLAIENGGASFADGADVIAADTKAAVNTEGTYNLDDYDIHAYLFSNFGITDWAGLATLGGSNHWINGQFTPETMVHEFGHNFGLPHANYWLTSDGTSFGTGGEIGYGGIFDIMGDGPVPQGHFSPWAKNQLNWVKGPNISAVDGEGIFRVHRIDDASTTGSKGLKVPNLDIGGALWLGYRPGFTPNQLLSSGAHVTWVSTSDRTRLIDTTPDSDPVDTENNPNDRQDAALQVGETLTLPQGGTDLHLTPIGFGGAPP